MRIFLSYSRSDSSTAEAIEATLKQAGHLVFFDRQSIKAAEDFNRIIWQEIQKADLFVYLVSPNSCQPGSYALTELGFAEKKWPNPERRVLPVIIDTTDLSAVPVYASICHILNPQGNVAAEVRSTVNALNKRHRWVRAGRAVAFIAVLAIIGLGGLWGYEEYLLQQPIKARETLDSMNIAFDGDSFIDHAESGDLQVVDLFLTANMDPDVINTFASYLRGKFSINKTALQAAVWNDHTEIVERLLEAGVDVNNKSSLTALALSALAGKEQIFRVLLAAEPTPETIEKVFTFAANFGDEETKSGRLANMRLLLSSKYNISPAAIDKVFIEATIGDSPEMLGILADRISDKPKVATAALLTAAEDRYKGERIENIKQLLALGADVNAVDRSGYTSLRYALWRDNEELARLLLEHGADPNDYDALSSGGGRGLLATAISRSSSWTINPVIDLLLAHGADVNLPSDIENNIIPLSAAAEVDNAEIIKILLEKGARVNELDRGFSALFDASANRNETIITMLLDGGADPTIGHNPLLATVKLNPDTDVDNRRKVVRLLIAAGADINKPFEKDDQTVLMRSVQTGDADMVRFYLEAGARVTDKDDKGRTAETLAKRGGHDEIVELLKESK